MLNYVYIIAEGKLFKIGVSKNPSKRLKQVAKHGLLVATCLVPFLAFKMEKMLHRRYQARRVRRPGDGGTEWFALTKLQLLYIRFLFWLLRFLSITTIWVLAAIMLYI